MNITSLVILIILTLTNIWLSWWISLRKKRYHGIFRFLSFESIILLVFMNSPAWFRDPFVWHQWISWILLIASLLVAIFGFFLFYHHGRPSDHMEETTQLISTGLYRYIRHPLYLSLILGGFGVMMKDPKWTQVILSIINLLAMYLTARVEENEMIRKFGQEYAEYMKKTKMFIPFIM
ncbi:methyltransferase family protein [Bacteroidota bacterium]